MDIYSSKMILNGIKYLFVVVLLSVSISSCLDKKICGLTKESWFVALQANKELPKFDGKNLNEIANLGDGAYLFIAMHTAAYDKQITIELLKNALQYEKGLYKKRSVKLLAEMYLDTKQANELMALCLSSGSTFLSDYENKLYIIKALLLNNSYDECANKIEVIRNLYPDESKLDDIMLSSLLAESAYRLGDNRWINEFKRIVELESSQTFYIMLDSLMKLIFSAESKNNSVDAVGSKVFYMAEARRLVGIQQYGEAVLAFRKYSTGLQSQLSADEFKDLFLALPRYAASDAAKAFITASKAEGYSGFKHIDATQAQDTADIGSRYFNIFWLGRFYRDSKQWTDAASCFEKARGLASGANQFDHAAWYESDSWFKAGNISKAISTLSEALKHTSNSNYYSDLIESISIDAITKKNYSIIVSLEQITSLHSSARDSIRIAYISARLIQLNLIKDELIQKLLKEKNISADNYIKNCFLLAYNQNENIWYKLLSAYRLGLDISLDSVLSITDNVQQSKLSDIDEYALSYAKFGFGAKLINELGDNIYNLSAKTVRNISASLFDNAQYTSSCRLAIKYFLNKSNEITKHDAELCWPKPYNDIVKNASDKHNIDEALLYGLIRSESLFDANVVSSAGAIGLTQLMPATASDVAKKLRLTNYELTRPADNVIIGSAYFASLIKKFDNNILPAVFSYNAGPSRFLRWEKSFVSLPFDIMLEIIPYAETRQYGRNVAQSALFYFMLYNKGDAVKYFSKLLGEN